MHRVSDRVLDKDWGIMMSSDSVHWLMMGYCCFVSCYMMSNLLMMHSSCNSFMMNQFFSMVSDSLVSRNHNRHGLMGNSSGNCMHRFHNSLVMCFMVSM